MEPLTENTFGFEIPSTENISDADIDYTNKLLDYINEVFIESKLIHEEYDTHFTDTSIDSNFFPSIYSILKLMNPSMKMLYDSYFDSWASYKGEKVYRAVYMWDSWIPWKIPSILFRVPNNENKRNIEEDFIEEEIIQQKGLEY